MPPELGPPPCLHHAATATAGWLDAGRLPALDDAEGAALPSALPPVVDAHVHLFPDPLFDAIWRWFEAYGWPVRYRLHAPQVIRFLLDRGVRHLVALHYAHKPGIARGMNAWMAALVREEPRVTATATVLPGEPGAAAILGDAFAAGLRGVKLHCHVQCFAPDDPRMTEIYDACVAHDQPLVMHAGRQPASPAYRCDPLELCGAPRIEAVLRGWPRLRLCVPHLGGDEFDAYFALMERYDSLWLDTTMVMSDYFGGVASQDRFLEARPERVMYGTDFPNLPYAWDREIVRVARRHPEERLAQVLCGTANAFYGLGLAE
ncbi:MAG: amidohydrolase [Deltaproteobacteria bacterium]|nr:amidohydrolase [Deltaproteobacteria bacterium]MCB9786607.1 amidohydrolase [Deltaproteobacteria bacterium]